MLRFAAFLLLVLLTSTQVPLSAAQTADVPTSFLRVCERIGRRFTPGTTPYERVNVRIQKRFGRTCDGLVPEASDGSRLTSPDGRFVFEVKSVDEGYGAVYRFVLTDTESERTWTARDFQASPEIPERMSAVGDALFTSNGDALLFVASTWGRGQSLVIIDLTAMTGREIYPHRSLTHLTLSPDQSVAAYVASQKNGPDADPMDFVVLLDVTGPLTRFGDMFQAVTEPPSFSEDGLTMTYVVSDRGSPLTINEDLLWLHGRCDEECAESSVCSVGRESLYCAD